MLSPLCDRLAAPEGRRNVVVAPLVRGRDLEGNRYYCALVAGLSMWDTSSFSALDSMKLHSPVTTASIAPIGAALVICVSCRGRSEARSERRRHC